MTAQMSETRFSDLAQAFGGDLRRWPESDRGPAEAWRSQAPVRAAVILAEAAALDAALDSDAAPAWNSELFERIVQAAPKAVSRTRLWRWISGAGLGLGLATACAGGVAVGAVLAPVALPVLQGQAAGGDDLSVMLDDASDVGVSG